jgi:peptidoglycan/xylan/chitin deacetylase (PgdA/CDA1 family)
LLSLKHNWQFYIINQLSPKNNTGIILTYDDGPHPIYTHQLLDLLKKENIKAIFFLIGKNIELYPDIVFRINNEGHLIGNHTYSHSIRWTFFNKKKAIEDLTIVENQIKNIIGHSNKIFRPPFGVTNPNIAYACNILNLKSITWNLRTYDTILSLKKTIKIIKLKLVGNQIVLMHDNRSNCIDITNEIINFCNDKKIPILDPNENII